MLIVAKGNPLPLAPSESPGTSIILIHAHYILTSLAVPQEVDSYHGLCPIEPLDTPTDQVS